MTNTLMAKKKQVQLKNKQVLSNKHFFMRGGLLILLITTAIYYQSLNNDFTNWDDPPYVVNNTIIRSFHGDSISYTIKSLLTDNKYVMGNFHPITMLTYCVEYSIYGLNPKPYHVTNLFFHLLNSLLVLLFIWLLCKKRYTAVIVALLFAIHPMHVESVAWVAERKDVLYTFFSLGALSTYLLYLKANTNKTLLYVVTIILFTLALLSKAMAASVAILFIAIDYYKNRQFNTKLWLEKLPFIGLAVVFGVIAIYAQQSLNALEDIEAYNVFDRILFSSYGVLTYIWKAILPINLSCFYSYPFKTDGLYPMYFYVSPIVLLTLFWGVYKSLKWNKDILFGFAFFLISIALVLQILPVGGAIIAERYTYIPYIGLFFIVGKLLNNIITNNKHKLAKYKQLIVGAFAVIIIAYAFGTYKRSMVWENSISLWTDAIDKYKFTPRAFSHRAKAYYKVNNYPAAIADYNWYIQIKNDNADIYYDRGVCFLNLKQYQYAITDFDKAIQLKPEFPKAYYNRGITYDDTGNYQKAIADYSTCIEQDPEFSDAYFNRGVIYFKMQMYEEALNDNLTAKGLGQKLDPRIIPTIQQKLNEQKQLSSKVN